MAEDATHGAADAAHAAADAAHGGGPGMPQLDFSTFPNQIFWLIVTLVAIYFILDKIALPRIASVLAERQGTLTNDLAAAEDLKRQAVEAEEAYNKALADARAEAQRIAEETRARSRPDSPTPRRRPMSRSPRKPQKARRASPRSRPARRNPSRTWPAMSPAMSSPPSCRVRRWMPMPSPAPSPHG
jgi:hypothetical protein